MKVLWKKVFTGALGAGLVLGAIGCEKSDTAAKRFFRTYKDESAYTEVAGVEYIDGRPTSVNSFRVVMGKPPYHVLALGPAVLNSGVGDAKPYDLEINCGDGNRTTLRRHSYNPDEKIVGVIGKGCEYSASTENKVVQLVKTAVEKGK